MLTKVLGTESDHEATAFGGKGSNLRHALNAGLLVPTTYVLLPSAYQFCLDANGISFDIGMLSRHFLDNRQSVLAESVQLQTRIEAMEFDLGSLCGAAQLAEIDNLLPSQVIVRSSALMEDGAKHSFAGCYRSYGGAVTRDELTRDIRRCWASSISLNVIGYLASRRLTAVPGMAVLIQPLIPTQKGGVCFTCDPRTGDRERFFIEAVPGMATGVVDGTNASEQYLLSRHDGRVIEHRGGGVTSDRGEPLLDGEELAMIRHAALQLDQLMGYPIDMEWGLYEQQLFLLQVRVVTTGKLGQVRQ